MILCLLRTLKIFCALRIGFISPYSWWRGAGGWLCQRLIFEALVLRDDAFYWSWLTLNLVTPMPSTTWAPQNFHRVMGSWVIQLVTKWSKKPIRDRVNQIFDENFYFWSICRKICSFLEFMLQLCCYFVKKSQKSTYMLLA